MLRLNIYPQLWVILVVLSVSARAQEAAEPEVLPDFGSITDVNEKKEQFFDFLNPLIQVNNERIATERAWLLQMQARASSERPFTDWQYNLLTELGAYYRVDEEPGSESYFSEMLLRVDTLPASMVLAQAANESAWGTSRFALEGNNLFGQWCFVEGCGLVPNSRPEGERYEVRLFESVEGSVEGYFQNINTHFQYADMRLMRAELRMLGEPLSSEDLMWALDGYSIRGVEYVREVLQMIRFNELQRFDVPAFYASNL
ncbi:MAG: glucosaminidase domain-containing protein [Saccharospirillum sp.]|nr:glucosaminidase domain-containing protein [Saccharospirillum sp.]